MDTLPLAPSDRAIPRGRGRPRGARNKRSVDLARYVEATFGGSTPGQQAAKLCLVSPGELKAARARAKDLNIAHPPRDPFLLAMVVKAAELAMALNCDRSHAWALLAREREGLMAYIHPKQGPAPAPTPGQQATVYMVPEGDGGAQGELVYTDDEAIEFAEDRQTIDGQVSKPKSHDVG